MNPPVSPRWDVIPGPIYTRDDAMSAILAPRFPPDAEVSAACLEQLRRNAPGIVIVRLEEPAAHRLVIEDGTVHLPRKLYGRARVDLEVTALDSILEMARGVGARLAQEARAESPALLGGAAMAFHFIGASLRPLSLSGPAAWVEGGTGEAYAVYVARYFLTPVPPGEAST